MAPSSPISNARLVNRASTTRNAYAANVLFTRTRKPLAELKQLAGRSYDLQRMAKLAMDLSLQEATELVDDMIRIKNTGIHSFKRINLLLGLDPKEAKAAIALVASGTEDALPDAQTQVQTPTQQPKAELPRKKVLPQRSGKSDTFEGHSDGSPAALGGAVAPKHTRLSI
jgi:hypothetical protein